MCPLSCSASEEDVLKNKQSIRSQALGNQNSESETLLDADDDTLSSLDDKELDNVTGTNHTVPAGFTLLPIVLSVHV